MRPDDAAREKSNQSTWCTVSEVKQQVTRMLEQLPDDCTLEDVQYQLYVMETIRHRLELANASGSVPHSEAEAKLEKWLTP